MIKSVDLIEKETFIELENEKESMPLSSKGKTNYSLAYDISDSDNDW